MRNVAKNFFYQALFQITKIIIPIVTVPIVSNALGPRGVGLYNYSNSIAQYFVLFAGLGVSLYGNREIALKWNKNENISKIFWEIFIFKACATIIVLVVYLFIVSFFQDRNFFYAQSLIIFAVLFDISWFFMGIEDFKKVSLCNLVVQIVTFIGIILFVKSSGDTLKYTLIQTTGMLLSQVLVWFFVKDYIDSVKVTLRESILHFKGSIEYFIPQVAIIFYTNINKTILGIVLGSTAVGYFSNSLQLNNVFITVITTLDIVLLPHMSGLYAKSNEDRIIRVMGKTLNLQLFISIPLMFGILTVYDKLVPWFFGEKFLFVNRIIPWFSLLIVVIPIGMSISRQYLMPVGQIKEYNKSVLIGAVINVIMNLLLLPIIGFFGVVIANIVAECFVTIVRLKSFLSSTNFKFNLLEIVVYFLSGMIMCIFTRYLSNSMPPTLLTNMIQFTIAVPIYLIITTLLKVNPIIPIISRLKK